MSSCYFIVSLFWWTESNKFDLILFDLDLRSSGAYQISFFSNYFQHFSVRYMLHPADFLHSCPRPHFKSHLYFYILFYHGSDQYSITVHISVFIICSFGFLFNFPLSSLWHLIVYKDNVWVALNFIIPLKHSANRGDFFGNLYELCSCALVFILVVNYPLMFKWNHHFNCLQMHPNSTF